MVMLILFEKACIKWHGGSAQLSFLDVISIGGSVSDVYCAVAILCEGVFKALTLYIETLQSCIILAYEASLEIIAHFCVLLQ
jgi:hypothetical protein